MNRLQTEVLIIGAGIAGLTTGIELVRKGVSVCLVTQGAFLYSGSTFNNINGKWGITYARDDAEKTSLLAQINHISHGTNISELSEYLVAHSDSAFKWLKGVGIKFEHDGKKRVSPCFSTVPLASIICSVNQVREVIKPLRNTVQLIEHSRLSSLIIRNERCVGCVIHRGLKSYRVEAKYGVVLAAGGDAGKNEFSIADADSTGECLQLALDAEAAAINLDYKQFIWSDIKRDRIFPLMRLFDNSVSIYGCDNKPLLKTNEKFRSHESDRITHVPIANLQTDRALDSYLMGGISTTLCSGAVVLKNQEGRVLNEILPHQQASNGGLLIDRHGRTTLSGVYAAGEITGGMHGGDRIGGMMISSAVVFGMAIARYIAKEKKLTHYSRT